MIQMMTAYWVQNAVEDPILAEKFIEGVTKSLVDNSIPLAKAFIEAYSQGGVLDYLV